MPLEDGVSSKSSSFLENMLGMDGVDLVAGCLLNERNDLEILLVPFVGRVSLGGYSVSHSFWPDSPKSPHSFSGFSQNTVFLQCY